MGRKIAGGVVLLVIGALMVAALIKAPVLWLAPFVWFVGWIIINERRIKIHNPSPTEETPDRVPYTGRGSGFEGVERVDEIAGGAGWIVHPVPTPVNEEE